MLPALVSRQLENKYEFKDIFMATVGKTTFLVEQINGQITSKEQNADKKTTFATHNLRGIDVLLQLLTRR